jgi:small subunit ribosomal protein S21
VSFDGLAHGDRASRMVTMIEVVLSDDDRIEWALKAFKKKVLRAGILKDLRKKRHYVKPSAARALKSAAAQRRARTKKRSPE